MMRSLRLLVLVYVGLACGQPEPQVNTRGEPSHDCQELIRRLAAKRRQEGTLAQDTGWSQTGALGEDSQWSLVTGVRTARYNHTATLLGSGKVLIAGGSSKDGGWLNSTELYHPAQGKWKETRNSLTTPRDKHMATVLLSGKVLVAGGFHDIRELASAELYDPETETWTPTSPMVVSRASATMTCLPSGKVLVAGGYGSDLDAPFSTRGELRTAELYDPETGEWRLTSNMTSARQSHTATLLPSGKVLIAGGHGSDKPNDPTPKAAPLQSAEVYDPELETWTPTSMMSTACHLHTATRLPSGKVLIAGGNNTQGFIAEAEEYDPDTDTWTTTDEPLIPARDKHTATLLPSGKVLISGGEGEGAGPAPLSSPVEYDPISRSWTSLSGMNVPRFWHTATLLPSGKVLLAGGKPETEVHYDEVYDEALAAPQVTRPTPGEQFLDDWRVDIAGTAEPNSTVIVSLDEARPVPVLADADGAWSHTLAGPLTHGPHTLSARVIDLSGNGSEPASVTFEMLSKSHHGWSCSSTSAFPALGISLVVFGVLLRRDRRAHPSR